MSSVTCPKCGLVMKKTNGGWEFDDESKCSDLAGTKYMNFSSMAQAGVIWCPTLSDEAWAKREWHLLASGHRQAVLDEISKKSK